MPQRWLVWLSWWEHCPVSRKGVSSIPGQSACLSCGFGCLSGCVGEAADQRFSLIEVSLPFSLPSLLSKINKHVLG